MAVQYTQNSPARTRNGFFSNTLDKSELDKSDTGSVQAIHMQNHSADPPDNRPTNPDVQHRVEQVNEQLNTPSHNSVSHNSVQNQPQQQPDYTDESPELLRWRADNLLDEMMLGAVDVSAGDAGSVENGTAREDTPDVKFPAHAPRQDEVKDLGAGEVESPGAYRSTLGVDDATTGQPASTGINHSEWGVPKDATEQPVDSRTDVWGQNEWSSSAAPANHAPINPSSTNPSSRSEDSPPDTSSVPPAPARRGAEDDAEETSFQERHNGSSRPETNGAVGNGAHPSNSNGSFTPSFVAAPFPSAGPVKPAAASTEPTAPPADQQPAAGPRNNGASLLHPPAAVESQLRWPAASDGTHNGVEAGEMESTGANSNGGAQNGSAQNGGAQPSGQPTPPAGAQPAQRPDQILNDYITNREFQREQERKQWSIMSGRSNDYPSSVPRSSAYGDSAAAYPYGSVDRPVAGAAGAGEYGAQAMPFADAMAVGPQARRRTNVLPRQSIPDMDALREEILLLQEQVETALPLGKDTADRARHLVEKAHSILGFGVERAAEVSYYIQQVRAILQRVEQRVYWSNIYRRRLRAYLVSWLALAIILLLSCFLYSTQLQMAVVNLFGLSPNSWLPLNAAPFLFTFAAGAAGSSAAALFNMWRHSQKDYGFFDRKYGMLGIVLPVIGVLVGSVLYGLFTGLYALFGWYAAADWLFGSVPALLAFVFGCGQEHIYGTSD